MIRITGTLHEDQRTCMIISRCILFRMSKFSDTIMQKIKTHVLYTLIFFAHIAAICEITWKNMFEPNKPHMTIWRVRLTCWTTKATDTNSEYVIFIAFIGQQL